VAGAPLIGLGPEVGVLVGSLAMAGDLVSSFVKRRMDLPPSNRARASIGCRNRCYRYSSAAICIGPREQQWSEGAAGGES
jgi:hypothetical protein